MHISALSWEWATIIRVLVGFGLCQGILIKFVAQQGRRTERFLWQFVFTFAFAALWAVVEWNAQRFDAWFLAFVGVGFVGAFGTFYQWRALAISQTRNALFTFWDDIVAMSLAVVLLGEESFLTTPVGIGIGLSFFGLFLFIRHAWMKKKSGAEAAVPLRFYGYIAIYSVMWGVAYFGERYWAFREFPVSGFLLAWYTGTLLLALCMFLFYKDAASEEQDLSPIDAKGLVYVFVLAVAIFATMALTIVAYKAPQVIVQPIFFVSEMVIPSVLGVLLWREKLDGKEWFYFAVALIGALMVGLNFQ